MIANGTAGSGRKHTRHSSHGALSPRFCSVQFSAPIFIADEAEGKITVGVMRLGCPDAHVSCKYSTANGSAVAGRKYIHCSGIIVMEPGCKYKEIDIDLINNQRWSATVEFKVILSDPVGCELGAYMHTCRVKIADDDLFPSNKYWDLLKQGDEESIDQIPKFGIVVEYFCLNMSVPGARWKTLLTLFMEQVHNVYFIFTLYVNIYMVDVLFKTTEHNEDLLLTSSRDTTAVLLGVLYVMPLLLLHAWDRCKANIDIHGLSSAYLKKAVMRKYMNYSESARSRVRPAELTMALTNDAHDCAHGFVALLDTSRIAVKLVLLAIFIIRQNPQSVVYLVLLPLVMLAFGFHRHSLLADADAFLDDQTLGLLRTTEEICRSYKLIAEYWQRPKMNEVFQTEADRVSQATIKDRITRLDNAYFPRWLGTLCISFFIITNASLVLQDKISVGSFLATIRVFQTISSDFAELYMEFLKVTRTIDPIKGLTFFLNLPTDLQTWKHMADRRQALTTSIASGDSKEFPLTSDGMPIILKGVTFQYDNMLSAFAEPILEDVNIHTGQGNLVAVIGSPDCGKATLMRLLGHTLFPNSNSSGETGIVFIPSHFRVLHVSQEPLMIAGSAIRNLTFGLSDVRQEDLARVLRILSRLKMRLTFSFVSKSLKRTSTTESIVDYDSDDFNGRPVEESESLMSEFKVGTDGTGGGVGAETESVGGDHAAWLDVLTYSEKVKISLARAFIVNPEVLIIQRPLHDGGIAELLLGVIREYVQDRGVCMPPEPVIHRVPTTCFFTPETYQQALQADVMWEIDGDTKKVNEVSREEISNRPMGHMRDDSVMGPARERVRTEMQKLEEKWASSQALNGSPTFPLSL